MINQQTVKLSPSQRANLFAQSTRQYKQELPSMTFKEGQQVSMTLPKTRFLSRIFIKVKGTVYKDTENFSDTSTKLFDLATKDLDIYKILRQVRLSINNGFNPYQIGGAELAIYNMVTVQNRRFGQLPVYAETINEEPSDGINFNYTLELPITINERDPIGLLMLQNEQTSVTLSVDCGYFKEINGFFLGKNNRISNLEITPTLETFSIPQLPEAIPDYSIIKIVNQQMEQARASGDNIVKLPVGLTYRKILVYITDTEGNPLGHEEVNNFQLIFNQADTPYNINSDHLKYENDMSYGQLPNGVYVFDFSNQGVANLGGGRDYIDTERLTEFWLKVNLVNVYSVENSGVNITIIKENLARLV